MAFVLSLMSRAQSCASPAPRLKPTTKMRFFLCFLILGMIWSRKRLYSLLKPLCTRTLRSCFLSHLGFSLRVFMSVRAFEPVSHHFSPLLPRKTTTRVSPCTAT